MPSRRDWLLIFLSLPRGKQLVDQLRAVKGMFLLDKDGPEQLRGLYEFYAHRFGPFSKEIYADLDELSEQGLIRLHLDGHTHRTFHMTETGCERAEQLVADLTDNTLNAMIAVKRFVTSLNNDDLLRHVYRRYPEFTVNSVAQVNAMDSDAAYHDEIRSAILGNPNWVNDIRQGLREVEEGRTVSTREVLESLK